MAEKTSFSCGNALDISHASALHSRLLKAIQKAPVIELKAQDVEKADTAGLQLLVALIQETETAGGKVVWKKPSAPLIEAAQLLGLEKSLGLSSQ